MSDEWVETTLGEVANYINGYPFKPADLSGSRLPVIRIKQLLDPSADVDYTDVDVPDKVLISDGDLIFSWSGSLASRIWDRGAAALNQHLFRVVERPGVSRGWLHLALDHAVTDLMEKTHGTTMKHVTKGVLESHRVTLPPLAVQRRIVDLMAHLDNHLANLRAEREALVMARTLFIDELTCGPLSIGGRFGALDEWQERSIGNLCTIKSGYAFKSSDWIEGGTPVIQIGNVKDFRIDSESMKSVSEEIAESAKRFRVVNGDILVAMTGNVGTVARVTALEEGFLVNQRVGLITECQTDQVDPDWLFFLLKSSPCQEGMRGRSKKSIQANISPTEFHGIPVRIPPLPAQREIAALLGAISDDVRTLDVEAAGLSDARTVVLTRLLSNSFDFPAGYDSLLVEVA